MEVRGLLEKAVFFLCLVCFKRLKAIELGGRFFYLLSLLPAPSLLKIANIYLQIYILQTTNHEGDTQFLYTFLINVMCLTYIKIVILNMFYI